MHISTSFQENLNNFSDISHPQKLHSKDNSIAMNYPHFLDLGLKVHDPLYCLAKTGLCFFCSPTVTLQVNHVIILVGQSGLKSNSTSTR